jgi:hypothetical protein
VTPIGREPSTKERIGEGPVSEQNVYIAGFNILECADLDENPGASFRILELRPIEP